MRIVAIAILVLTVVLVQVQATERRQRKPLTGPPEILTRYRGECVREIGVEWGVKIEGDREWARGRGEEGYGSVGVKFFCDDPKCEDGRVKMPNVKIVG